MSLVLHALHTLKRRSHTFIHTDLSVTPFSAAGTLSLPEAPDPVFQSMLEKRRTSLSPMPRDRRALTAVLLAEQAQKRALQRRAPQGQTVRAARSDRGLSPGTSRLAVVGALKKRRWDNALTSISGTHSVHRVDKRALGRFWDRSSKEGRSKGEAE